MGTNAVSLRPSNPTAKLISGVEQEPKSRPAGVATVVDVEAARAAEVVVAAAAFPATREAEDPEPLEPFPLLDLDPELDFDPELDLDPELEPES